MIAGLLSGAAQLGLAGAALRRIAMRLAIGLVAVVLIVGMLLIAVAFAAIGAYLSLEGVLSPAEAALVVAAGLVLLAVLVGLIAWLVVRRRTPVASPLGKAASANPLHLAAAAFGAGIAAGHTMFRRR